MSQQTFAPGPTVSLTSTKASEITLCLFSKNGRYWARCLLTPGGRHEHHMGACQRAASSALPWRRQWHPTPVPLPGKSHGRRSLVGCSPWGRKESDMTERLAFHFSLSCIGEGNGNPLQCSCLENPRDGEPGGLPPMGSHRVGHD